MGLLDDKRAGYWLFLRCGDGYVPGSVKQSEISKFPGFFFRLGFDGMFLSDSKENRLAALMYNLNLLYEALPMNNKLKQKPDSLLGDLIAPAAGIDDGYFSVWNQLGQDLVTELVDLRTRLAEAQTMVPTSDSLYQDLEDAKLWSLDRKQKILDLIQQAEDYQYQVVEKVPPAQERDPIKAPEDPVFTSKYAVGQKYNSTEAGGGDKLVIIGVPANSSEYFYSYILMNESELNKVLPVRIVSEKELFFFFYG